MLYLCDVIAYYKNDKCVHDSYIIVSADSYEDAVNKITDSYSEEDIVMIDQLRNASNLLFLSPLTYKDIIANNFITKS